MFVNLKCADAVDFAKELADSSIDLYICDPPFGIGEDRFTGSMMSRDHHIPGYVTAPDDYYSWSKEWLSEMYRTLRDEGTAYVILGSTYNLAKAMIAAEEVGFYSSNPGDVVCDLFMGNYTTAKVAIEEGRSVMGCDKNPITCDYWIPKLQVEANDE